MSYRNELRIFNHNEHHKGFYNDDNPTDPLYDIKYTDFWDEIDEDSPYYFAHSLLCGSCHIFALSLQRLLNYCPYIIEDKNKGYHAFCQIYKNGTWYYVDARGITSSFDEFMTVARTFIRGEYIIREVSQEDIEEWKNEDYYTEEGYSFAQAIIEKYKECYTLQ